MRLGVIIVALLLVLSACKPVVIEDVPEPAAPVEPPKPQAPEPNPNVIVETPPETAVSEPVAEPVVNETAEPEETVYERPVEAPPSIMKYQVIFRRDVTNYKFMYKGDQWFVQGKRAKLIPFRILENIYHAPFIDTIYFDLENRTVVGVCEGRDDSIKRQCMQQNALGTKFSMPYIQFKIPLPEDWLTEYQNVYMTVADAPKLVTDRDTVHLKHQSQTRVIDVYIDPAIGLPLAVLDNGVEYKYERLSKNSLGFGQKMVP